MTEPLVSVVIPTFRREVMVVEAVRSALAQTGVRVEVIVLDDSAEGSAASAIAAVGDPRVRYVHRAVPSGGNPALVRNEGLSLATGEYVHFLDDDDVLCEGALAATVAALVRKPSAGVAVGMVVPFGDDPVALEHERAYFAAAARRLKHARTRFTLTATMLFDVTPLVNSECTVRRSCAQAVGGYSPDVARCEDVDFYLRAIRHCGFVLVDRPVVRYRTGTPSLMHSQSDEKLLVESYDRIHRHYRRQYGVAEVTIMRLFVLASALGASCAVLFGMESCVPW
ncbi:glycosyl transferase family 2 [Gemmatirosa kalamazoonensis]|uniref:Glycosyl transferase family 2 n=1 Tax=Gemmatirosa kalamazoonensis TaxID=861299 RepID=W0R981_9BACT|nr:glycosyltransferase [Gemmatirosa kalamazoonensis]AHG87669.1 glycosyl transferase family 2 [Gemmatirosa kalamazoonensis]